MDDPRTSQRPSRPATRSSRRALVKTTAGSLAAGALLGATTAPALAVGETLIVPFALGTTGVTTKRAYKGRLTIKVSGVGQAAGSQFSDAFYIFTDPDGAPVPPWRLPDGGFTLWINGAPADAYLASTPPYQENHAYKFQIKCKGSRLRFSFAVGDEFVADNSGEFVVTIKKKK